MSGDIIWSYWVSRGVTQVRITLRFKERLCESAIRLSCWHVHMKSRVALLHVHRFTINHGYPASLEDIPEKRTISSAIHDFKSLNLSLMPRTYRVPANFIKSTQPRFTILRSVTQ